MRVILVHNPDAGSGSPTRAELLAWLSDAGYQAEYQSTKSDEFPESLDDASELLVVAGGDGTVADVMRAVAGRDVPVAILPLGTANNVANALGIRGSPADIIGRLQNGTSRPLDVGTAQARWGLQRFVESAGLGLFAKVLRDAKREEIITGHDTGRHDLENGRGDRMQKALSGAQPVKRRVLADGVDLSGDYLFVGAFNIPFIGSRLSLAPDADPGDGRLDLLLVREAERDQLAEYLERVSNGLDARLPIATRKCEEIVVGWESRSGHLDDSGWPAGNQSGATGVRTDVVLSIDQKSVPILGASVHKKV
jgi:diacylglycerol kinase family enzyme